MNATSTGFLGTDNNRTRSLVTIAVQGRAVDPLIVWKNIVHMLHIVGVIKVLSNFV